MYKNLHILLAVLFIAVFIYLSGTDKANTERVLQEHGFTNISTDGYSWWGCDDLNKTKFTATTPNGIVVSGYVGYTFSKAHADIVILN